jgi:hypothetical protein
MVNVAERPKDPTLTLYTWFPLFCQKFWSMLPKNLMTQLSPVHPIPSHLSKGLVNVAEKPNDSTLTCTPSSLSFAKSFGQCCQKPNDSTLTCTTVSLSFVSRPIVGSDDSCDLVSWFSVEVVFALSCAISWRSRFIEDSIFWF